MLTHMAYKFRIYPTKEQEILIAKTIGCSRFVFNHFLAKWDKTYKATGKGLSYGSCSKELPVLKQAFDWLKEVDSTSVQTSVKHLADAFDRFFNRRDDGVSLFRFRPLGRITQESSISKRSGGGGSSKND